MKTASMIGILLLVLALVSLMILGNNKAEFFDLFGIVVFLFLIYVGAKILFSKKKIKKWEAFILLLVGVLGLIVDGFNIIRGFVTGG